MCFRRRAAETGEFANHEMKITDRQIVSLITGMHSTYLRIDQ